MPSANRMTTAVAIDADELEGRYAPLGDYTVSFETFKQDADPAPYFVGLPDDRCPCAHLGGGHRRSAHVPLARPRGDLRRR